MSADFYDTHYLSYYEKTLDADPSRFLQILAGLLEKGAKVLDVGCGSGRDLLWLKQHGFRPTGFERSAGLAELAAQHSGCPVIRGDFLRYDFSCLRFEAVLLVGALVHLKEDELAPALVRISQALAADGLIYLTLKEGHGSLRGEDGRIFLLWERESLERTVVAMGFEILEFSRGRSALDNGDVWLGYVLKRRKD
ncbi:MAG: methyltransferase domain-containing protein [Desulfobulbaceae bacterium]|nr:MAG: methyltransferase domain-containing protein [Desulfobulbaceae bacterium]